MLNYLSEAAHTVQHMAGLSAHEESEMEATSRRNNGFLNMNMPDVKPRPTSANAAEKTQKAFSYLGSHNPFGTQVTAHDTVWLLNNTAYRNATTHEWEAELVACVFDQDTGLEVSTVVADIAEKLGIGRGASEEATIRERLIPIMQNIMPGRVVNVTYPNAAEMLKLGPGGHNGISSDIRELPSFADGEIVSSTAKVPQGTNGLLSMKTFFAEPEGWGVISDIDDTIKITLTSSPLGILKSTFAAIPTPTQGMPDLYRHISTLLGPTTPFFYLSASPYNLYPFLSKFLESTYPHGTMILRDASWMNLEGLFENLTLGVRAYKDDRMVKIHGWIGRRKMICIGDSTQSDPEAYGDMYRKYPGWVKLILIRKVTDIAAVGMQAKNAPQRFENAFAGVPRECWHVFEKAEECWAVVDGVVAADK